MDLQQEFSVARSEAVSKKVTEKDLSSATELLDNLIVPKLRKQKAVRPTLTYYCITFYVIDVESGQESFITLIQVLVAVEHLAILWVLAVI